MTEKTLSNQLAERFLGDTRQTVLFVGYADPASPGGRLKAAQLGDLVQLDEGLPSQRLACQVREFDFSAHAPRELLFDYIRRISPKIVVLVHGDPPAVSWFNSRIAMAKGSVSFDTSTIGGAFMLFTVNLPLLVSKEFVELPEL